MGKVVPDRVAVVVAVVLAVMVVVAVTVAVAVAVAVGGCGAVAFGRLGWVDVGCSGVIGTATHRWGAGLSRVGGMVRIPGGLNQAGIRCKCISQSIPVPLSKGPTAQIQLIAPHPAASMPMPTITAPLPDPRYCPVLRSPLAMPARAGSTWSELEAAISSESAPKRKMERRAQARMETVWLPCVTCSKQRQKSCPAQ